MVTAVGNTVDWCILLSPHNEMVQKQIDSLSHHVSWCLLLLILWHSCGQRISLCSENWIAFQFSLIRNTTSLWRSFNWKKGPWTALIGRAVPCLHSSGCVTPLNMRGLEQQVTVRHGKDGGAGLKTAWRKKVLATRGEGHVRGSPGD